MRNNPDNNTLGNFVGREAGDSDPETSSQSEVARNPDQINIRKAIDDKRVGDIEKKNNNQLNDENDEEKFFNIDV
jgi:hypothetical protein